MSSLRDLRRRVGTVRSIRQITGAMKMVAAARLRRAQEAILAGRPYARKIEEILRNVLERADLARSPLLGLSPGRAILLVVVTADKGLCGAFNANVIREARRFMAEHADRPIEILAIGRKGRDHFVRRGIEPRLALVDLFRSLAFECVLEPRARIIGAFTRGEIGEAHIIHNEFKSALVQNVVTRRLLPVHDAARPREAEPCRVRPEVANGAARPQEAEPCRARQEVANGAAHQRAMIDFEYDPDANAVFAELLPRYVAIELWIALLESRAAEMAARIGAMGAATTNADGMISRLTLVANRLRQAGITREIAEITAGAEASA
jgi:F-type H+-transporting ATPase subunit gamma